MSLRILLMRSRFLDEVGSSTTRFFLSPSISYSCKMPGGTNLGGITGELHKRNFVSVFALLVQRACCRPHREELTTLFCPRKTVPVPAFSVDNEDHCFQSHCRQCSVARTQVNRNSVPQIGLKKVLVGEDNRTHRLHLVANGNKARVLFVLFAKCVENSDCPGQGHSIVKNKFYE